MKKIYLAMIAVIVAAIIPMQVIADNSYISISNDKAEVKFDVDKDINRVSADTIFPDITTCKEKVSRAITVKSTVLADVSLRLGAKELPGDGTSPLNNYKITVIDASDKVIYDSETSPMSGSVTYREIGLGRVEAGVDATYTVEYELIDDNVNMSMISIEVGAKAIQTATVAPTAKPTQTLKPKYDFNNTSTKNEFVFDFDNEIGETDKTATGTSLKEIKKICGEDIPAGRFSVTGNGILKITSKNGKLKNTYIVSETASKSDEVKETAIVLEDGDVLIITPLDGQEKAKLKFGKIETDNEKTTATPVKADTEKNNPKTGDNNIGIVIGIGVFAILAVIGLEFLKRKSRTNN